MIRIGVVAAQAQLGQGSQAGMDYGTPIRNALVHLLSGPAVEVAALDSSIPVQIQAEARQKQCDFILYSNVTVKPGGGHGGFGKFLSIAAPIASMAPMAGEIGGAVAGSVASQAASAAAQQAAMSQMTGITGQIKSKDEVSVSYQLFPTGQDSPQVAELSADEGEKQRRGCTHSHADAGVHGRARRGHKEISSCCGAQSRA
jgi:hypothetical protein